MKYGLIGKKLGHSFSKEVHALLSDYEYTLWELPDEKAVGKFLTEKDFAAINVTIPYKETVIPYLEEISAEARAIGAVNTIVNRNGILYGYNTDFYGMTAALAHIGAKDLSGMHALILGTGGTALTAKAVLRSLGAASVKCVSRTPKGEAISYADAIRAHANADILINTTPVGMFPNAEDAPISLSLFPRLRYVFDAVYNPLSTLLVSEAKARGIAASGGLYMLVAQGFLASELFLGKEFPPSLLDEVYEKIVREKNNIVLIGMPSAGKTTIGKALAKETGKAFCDLDELIAQRAEKDIPAIFREEGESGFRERECEIIREVSQKTGLIIATGGGAVLRVENIARLKRNGILCFLDRPLAMLTPTSDRPTANDAPAMEARYRERLPIYRAAADLVFAVNEDFSQTVTAIRKELAL